MALGSVTSILVSPDVVQCNGTVVSKSSPSVALSHVLVRRSIHTMVYQDSRNS